MRRTTPFVVVVVLAVMILGPTGCKNPYCPSTEEPYVVIDSPPPSNVLPQVVKFTWHSGLEEDPKAVRYFVSLLVDMLGNYNPGFDVVRDLNEHPERYEDKWSEPILYRAPDGSGQMAIIGDAPRSATAKADEASRLFMLDEKTFNKLMTKRVSIRILLNIVGTLSNRLREMNARYTRLKEQADR